MCIHRDRLQTSEVAYKHPLCRADADAYVDRCTARMHARMGADQSGRHGTPAGLNRSTCGRMCGVMTVSSCQRQGTQKQTPVAASALTIRALWPGASFSPRHRDPIRQNSYGGCSMMSRGGGRVWCFRLWEQNGCAQHAHTGNHENNGGGAVLPSELNGAMLPCCAPSACSSLLSLAGATKRRHSIAALGARSHDLPGAEPCDRSCMVHQLYPELVFIGVGRWVRTLTDPVTTPSQMQ